MPNDAESYVHRSGRTGRAGRSGTAILLHSERERRDLSNLERQTGIRFSKQGPPSVQTVMSAAAALVPKRISLVDPKLLPYFTDAAKEFLKVRRPVVTPIPGPGRPRVDSARARVLRAPGTKFPIPPRSSGRLPTALPPAVRTCPL